MKKESLDGKDQVVPPAKPERKPGSGIINNAGAGGRKPLKSEDKAVPATISLTPEHHHYIKKTGLGTTAVVRMALDNFIKQTI